MDKGLIHIYCGEGKGKTTAAAGLAIRALGAGLKVSFVQFMKNGRSSEIEVLKKAGAAVFCGNDTMKFSCSMTDEDREKFRKGHDRALREALAQECDLLVLDEACSALKKGLVDPELLKEAVLGKPEGREVVLTGREPETWMTECADYVTEMECVKHPFNNDIKARKGIEY